jgi:hypothetical protein
VPPLSWRQPSIDPGHHAPRSKISTDWGELVNTAAREGEAPDTTATVGGSTHTDGDHTRTEG